MANTQLDETSFFVLREMFPDLANHMHTAFNRTCSLEQSAFLYDVINEAATHLQHTVNRERYEAEANEKREKSSGKDKARGSGK